MAERILPGEIRLARLELIQMRGALAQVEKRVVQLEHASQPPSCIPNGLVVLLRNLQPWVQTVVVPIAILVIGFWLKDSVDLAVKQRQVDFSGLKDMRDLVSILYQAEPEKSQLDIASFTISSYGELAAPILLQAYNLGGAARHAAAERGLLAAAAHDPGGICHAIALVVESSTNRTGSATDVPLYSGETVALAQSLTSRLRCHTKNVGP